MRRWGELLQICAGLDPLLTEHYSIRSLADESRRKVTRECAGAETWDAVLKHLDSLRRDNAEEEAAADAAGGLRKSGRMGKLG